MYLKSPYPPVPPIPDENIHHYMFNTAASQGISDYTLHIDAISGRRRSWQEFRERVYDGATALGAPISQGGLGLSGENGDIVGIYSHNCMVRYRCCLPMIMTHHDVGLCCFGAFFASRNDSNCTVICIRDPVRVGPCSAHVQGDPRICPAFASREGFKGCQRGRLA